MCGHIIRKHYLPQARESFMRIIVHGKHMLRLVDFDIESRENS